jgi:hypothetical protein
MEKLIRASTHYPQRFGGGDWRSGLPRQGIQKNTCSLGTAGLGFIFSYRRGCHVGPGRLRPQDPARLTAMIAHPTTIDIHVAVN